MPEREVGSGSSLATLFHSKAMARLVVFFAVRPGERVHLRDLQRRTRLSSASLQREMRVLVEIGAVRREEEGGRVYFRANEEHDAWRAWALLLRSAAAPADVIREALVGAEGVQGAFLYGSAARGDARADSDVDLFLILHEGSPSSGSLRELSELELLIGRPLDVAAYTASAARERARTGNAFLRRVLAEPKAWLLGDAGTLAGIVAA
jgi:predicted nucleotidyltransferase